MPKTAGTPITITAGQPQREVTHFNVSVAYDSTGLATFGLNAFGTVRLRATDGTVVYQEEQKQFTAMSDAQLHTQIKSSLNTIISRLDAL